MSLQGFPPSRQPKQENVADTMLIVLRSSFQCTRSNHYGKKKKAHTEEPVGGAALLEIFYIPFFGLFWVRIFRCLCRSK